MLEGHMRHADNKGNRGLLRAGSVQWMTAGRGIVHSEMPGQDEGLLWGYQLWVNLPAAQKMMPVRSGSAAPAAAGSGELALLGAGDGVEISADGPARVLLVAGRPLREPIARHGPFVMNTRDELHEAFRDYEAGRF